MQQRTIQTGQRAGRRLIWSNKNMSNNMDWRFQHKEQDTKLIHQEICLLHGHIMLVWSSAHQSCENILVLIKNMHSLQRKHCQIKTWEFWKMYHEVKKPNKYLRISLISSKVTSLLSSCYAANPLYTVAPPVLHKYDFLLISELACVGIFTVL